MKDEYPLSKSKVESELSFLIFQNESKLQSKEIQNKIEDKIGSIINYFKSTATKTLRLDINCTSFALSSDSKFILLSNCEKKVFMYDNERNLIVRSISLENSQIKKILICRNLSSFYVLHFDSLSLINYEDNEKSSKQNIFIGDIFDFFVNDNESEILVVLKKGKVKKLIREEKNNKEFCWVKGYSLNTSSEVKSASFNGDTSTLLLGYENGKMKKIFPSDCFKCFSLNTEFANEITALVSATNGISFLAGDSEGNLFLINNSLEKLENIQQSKVRITVIAFAKIENFALVGRNDGKVEVWNLNYRLIYQILNLSLHKISSIIVDNNYNKESRNSTNQNDSYVNHRDAILVYYLSKSKLSTFFICPSESPKIVPLRYSLEENCSFYSDENQMYSIQHDRIVSIQLECCEKINLNIEKIHEKFNISILDKYSKILLICHDATKKIMDYAQIIKLIYSNETVIRVNSDEIISVFNSNSYLFFITEDGFSVFENGNKVAYFYIHSTDIHLISNVKSWVNGSEYFAVTYSNGIHFWKADHSQGRSIKLTEKIVKKVTYIEEKMLLFIVYEDENDNNLIELWETCKFNIMNSMRLRKIVNFLIKQQKWFVCLTYDSLSVFSIPEFTKHLSIKIYENPQSSCFFHENLIIAYKSDLIIYSMFLSEELQNSKARKIIGNSEEIHKIHQKMNKVILNSLQSKKKPKNDSQSQLKQKHSTWLFQPDHINELHIYAYLNDSKKLHKSLQKGVGLFASADGITPLDICLKMKHNESLYTIYTYLKVARLKNPLIMSVLENSIIDLIDTQLKCSQKIFKLFLCKSFDTTLPKFYLDKSNIFFKLKVFTYVFETECILPSSVHLNTLGNDQMGNTLKFKQTYFRLCMNPGSSKSIHFLTRVIHNEKNIFGYKLEFISFILDYKWRKVRKITYFMAILYFFYFTNFVIYIFYRDLKYLYAAFIINIIFFFKEIIQIIALKHRNFMIGWGMTYLSNNILTTVLFVFKILGYETNRTFEGFTFFTVLFKGYSYFRMTRKTGFYVNLLKWLFVDIFGFLAIFFYVIIGLAILSYTIYDFGSFFEAFRFSWELNLGQFNTDDFGGLIYFVFFIASFLCLVVLLNLLITIMTNTYQNLKNQILSSECKEIAQIIRESECFLYLINKNKNSMKYIFKVSSNIKILSKDQSSDSIFNRKFHSLKNKVKKSIKIGKNLQLNEMVGKK